MTPQQKKHSDKVVKLVKQGYKIGDVEYDIAWNEFMDSLGITEQHPKITRQSGYSNEGRSETDKYLHNI